MRKSVCGLDCSACELKDSCAGCAETGGKPFGSECVISQCCAGQSRTSCADCGGSCSLRERLMAEFNALEIAGMPEVTRLNPLLGRYANSEYALPGGQKAQLLNDNAVYLGHAMPSSDGTRLYGMVGNADFLAVSALSPETGGAELLLYKKR